MDIALLALVIAGIAATATTAQAIVTWLINKKTPSLPSELQIRVRKTEDRLDALTQRISDVELGLKDVSHELKSMSRSIGDLNDLIQSGIERLTTRIDRLVDIKDK